MSDEIASGRCLCGAVAYTISGNMGIFQYCHCSRCRKSTGSGFADFEPRLRGDTYEVCLDTADWILNEHRARNGLAIVPGTAIIQLVHAAQPVVDVAVAHRGPTLGHSAFVLVVVHQRIPFWSA